MESEPVGLQSNVRAGATNSQRLTLTRRRWLAVAGAAAAAALGGLPARAQQASPVASPLAAARGWRAGHRVGTWAYAPRQPFDWTSESGGPLPEFSDRTWRQIVHTSIGGNQVRIRLTNAHATEPAVVGAAHLAIAEAEGRIAPGSDRPLTFGGRSSIPLPPEGVVISDPVALEVPALGNLAVSLYLPSTVTASPIGLQATYVSPPGDFTGDPALPVDSTVQSWVLLTGVDVTADRSTGAIVAFGDSITDGFGSTPDTNRRWPDVLAARLLADPARPPVAVLNAGIGGNQVLRDGLGPLRFVTGASALARFDRDVLAQPGATHVIVLLGINDIGLPLAAAFMGEGVGAQKVGADEISAGLRIIAERAHEHGLVIAGGTVTPFGGSLYDTPETEATRRAVNGWIRTGGAFDAVIDFEAAVRDPAQPARLLPAYDSGDHLHPNDAGYRAMGEAIDLSLFRPAEG